MNISGLKPKQQEFFKAFRSGKYDYLCAAGTAGAGKTLGTLGLLHILCCKIGGLRFFVFRKSDKVLKQTTIPSYRQMKIASKSVHDSELNGMNATYKNGSEIIFAWADITKDPELNNIRGVEATGILFEEANQIHQKYFEIAKIRIGRWNKNAFPAFIMLNLNPSIGWVKDLFYDNSVNDTMPERHFFLEFDEEDARQCSGDQYVDRLRDLPEEEYRRFVKNRWDYSEIPNQLIKYEWYKQCIAPEDLEIELNPRVLGCTDSAWEGDDSTVSAIMKANHIGWWEEYDKQDPDISGVLAVERAREHGIQSGDWIVDPIGLGAATALKMRNDLKFEPDLFIAGATPENTFGMLEMYNKGSEAGWLLREALRLNEITIQHHPQAQKEFLAIKYSIDEKKFRIRPKKEMKKELGTSPGYYDVAKMLVHRFKTTEGGLAGKLFQRQLTAPTQGILTRAQQERAAIIRGNRIRE